MTRPKSQKKLLCWLAACIVPMALVTAYVEVPKSEPIIFAGCEGEGCGCARNEVTNKPVTLYEKMQLDAPQLGSYPAGTQAKNMGGYTKIIKRGKYRVTKVSDESLGLKPGDMVDTPFGEGEGFFSVEYKGKTISANYETLEYEEIEPSVYEPWYAVGVDGRTGYATVFPFEGCLE